MKKKTKPTGFWLTLESLPSLSAVAFEWKKRTGSDYDSIQGLLKPNGRVVTAYPCIHSKDCGCYHDIVQHSPEDIVAECRCGRECDTFQVTSTQLAVYELDRQRLDAAVAKVFNLNQSNVVVKDIPRTSCIGQLTLDATHLPFFMTFQPGSMEYTATVEKLLVRFSTPFVLLTPLPELISVECSTLLSTKGCYTIALSDSVIVKEKFKLTVTTVGDEFIERLRLVFAPTLPACVPDLSANEDVTDALITIDRRVIDGDVHWFVNGEDKGSVFKRSDKIRAKVLDLLYDNIGVGWVTHDILMRNTGWNENEYYRSFDNPGRMQRLVSEIRSKLGMKEIVFQKSKGVRFTEKVRKSRKQSK